MNAKKIIVTIIGVVLVLLVFLLAKLLLDGRGQKIINSSIELNRKSGTLYECLAEIDSLSTNDGYEIKNGRVYFLVSAIGGADPKSFQVLDEDGIVAKDARSVYIAGLPITTIDQGSFEYIGESLFKDKENTYLLSTVGRVPSSYPFEDNPDKVYDCEEIMSSIQYEEVSSGNDTVKIAGSDVMFILSKIKDVDTRSFRVEKYEYFDNLERGMIAKDKENVYMLNQAVNVFEDDQVDLYKLTKINNADPETFSILGIYYAKDSNNVYEIVRQKPPRSSRNYYSNVIFTLMTNADADSFRIILPAGKTLEYSGNFHWGITGEDVNNVYARDLQIPKTREITSWIGNMSDTPMTCSSVCSNRGLQISEGACYGDNLKTCTVASGSQCISGDRNSIVSNDYTTSCCCAGDSVEWVYEQNNQRSVCVSTDGQDPYTRGTTRGITVINEVSDFPGTEREDECSGDMLTEYSCGIDGGSVVYMNAQCPNGCLNGAFLK